MSLAVWTELYWDLLEGIQSLNCSYIYHIMDDQYNYVDSLEGRNCALNRGSLLVILLSALTT